MKVVLPDTSELELPDGATGLDAARAIGSKLAEQAVLVRSNGSVQDLRLPLQDGQHIHFLTTRDTDDPDALYVLRHSAAHLLAEAVRRLYPGVKVAIGPPIENGFYYDFDFPEPVTEADLAKIENEVRREIKEGREWSREEISRDEAKQRFEAEGEPYKVELVDTAQGDISLYSQLSNGVGEFTDLCRGPHLQNAKPIKAFKLTGLAGAYWRGDEKNKQLTRIYGTAFYNQADLDAHLARLEEARKRDHRKLGVQLDLFHLEEISPGSPFWHPKGMVIFNELEAMRRRENASRGYFEVKTPLIFDKVLWERSGHWEKFRENMFLIPEEDHTYAIKPMNCPGHMVLFANTLRSYRELPLRYAEAAPLHRNEPSGTLHGLTRVRHVTQDDAHIFCTREQIEDEIFGCLDYAKWVYDLFGLDAGFELSTRPDNKLGTDEEWDFTEGALQAALDRRGLEYSINPGDGAFYGPKIDLHMKDSLGRAWQMGTIQLDSQTPGRLNCRYIGADNAEHVPYVVHRALMGSFERFIGILTEHYAGAFPFWIAPVQVRIIPVAEVHHAAAAGLAEKLAPFRVEVDDSNDTLGKRIRNAEVEKIPFVIVFGDKESDDSLAIREHGGEQTTRSLGDLRAKLATLNPWQAGAEPSLTS
ncbi:MAG: threonyl-tRNA synthetase [Gaiellaceae bacterium]|jgi:threonyl-tRNA synthetase|nr:threonyl-tRNA synthetase [Gaiellaceae bacterium]